MNKYTLNILRMSPGNARLIFETDESFDFFALVGISGEAPEETTYRKLKNKTYEIFGLKNSVDYEISLIGNNGVCSQARPFRCGEFPGTIINYIHPDDKTYLPSGMCPASPSIIKTTTGRLYVSHDIFCFNMAQNQTKIFFSDDDGDTWNFHSSVEGCFWGKLFVYRDTIYLLGNMHEYGDLVLYELDEVGNSWRKACTILKGGNKYTGGPHKAPMPVVEHKGRIWTAIEYGSWHLGGHACGVISAGEDIRIANNWTVSEFTEYDPAWPGTPDGESTGCIEGNIVIMPDGSIIDFLRIGIDKCEPNYGKALYLTIDKENPKSSPEFGEVIDFHGNHTKFCIYYDITTKKYWTIVNKADHNKPRRRNELILMSSDDVKKWTIEKTLLDYEHTGWYENYEKTGFQYIDFLFNEDYIYYVSRTAINGAINYHDSNCITFHMTRYK
ncbi:MAG: hypothetical protein KAH14_08190 [Clostridiales bacterium]|nr:hypothetical protein [Clostridiales bacterium]